MNTGDRVVLRYRKMPGVKALSLHRYDGLQGKVVGRRGRRGREFIIQLDQCLPLGGNVLVVSEKHLRLASFPASDLPPIPA